LSQVLDQNQNPVFTRSRRAHEEKLESGILNPDLLRVFVPSHDTDFDRHLMIPRSEACLVMGSIFNNLGIIIGSSHLPFFRYQVKPDLIDRYPAISSKSIGSHRAIRQHDTALSFKEFS
jgi:hypothetical protein